MNLEFGSTKLAEMSDPLRRCRVDRHRPLRWFPKQLHPGACNRRRLRIYNLDGEIGCENRNTQDKHKKNTVAEPHPSSFTRERGWCWQFAPVSWLTSKDLGIFEFRAGRPENPWSNFWSRPFPSSTLVDRDDVLAYSCAAARDSHPLPCPPRARRTREPNSKVDGM